uniref:Uncharacterized protein n=1 Tax=viral metagenome TaxID=1070528 RepID=A0A6M3LI58_9ZZZZ
MTNQTENQGEMKMKNSEIAQSWELWQEYMDTGANDTEERFNSLTISERIAELEACFGADDESKHTPGPWTHIPRARDGHADRIAKGHSEFISVGCPHAETPILDYPHDNEQTANAKLIAAAPELLYALREIVSQIDQGGSGGKVFSRDACIAAARAAIAKAEGN